MAFLFPVLLITLTVFLLFLPITAYLRFDNGIELTIALPFIDITLSSADSRKKSKKKRNLRKRLKGTVQSLRAIKLSLDLLLKHSRLTVHNTADSDGKNLVAKSRSILFSIFISYLATKSGILITDGDYLSAEGEKRRTLENAKLDTRLYVVLLSFFIFIKNKIFPKKEYGIV